MKAQRGISRIVGLIAFTGLVIAMSLTPAARASNVDPLTPDEPSFTPELTFDTTATEAGANPDLTFVMEKSKRTGCYPNASDSPWGGEYCNQSNFYLDQSLKKMEVSLPPGLMADVNAAPYCDVDRKWVLNKNGTKENWWWYCKNQDARIGSLTVTTTSCYQNAPYTDDPDIPWYDDVFNCSVKLTDHVGAVYNAKPEPGEQGRLVLLWPAESGNWAWTKSEISVKVRESDLRIDSTADDIPDMIPSIWRYVGSDELIDASTPGQISPLIMRLEGSTGIEKGHPLLTNPTACEEQSINVLFQGYFYNSIEGGLIDPGGPPDDEYPDMYTPGYGDGMIVTPSPVPYQATDCESVPLRTDLHRLCRQRSPGSGGGSFDRDHPG